MEAENVLNALSADSFWVVNKALARHVGIEESVFVTELLFKFKYWRARGQLDERGGFFFTSKDAQAVLGIGDKAVSRLTKSVVESGVFSVRKRGVPAKHYWYANFKRLSEILSDPQTGGTGSPQTEGTSHPQTGVAITNKTDVEITTKRISSLYARTSALISEAHKHMTKSDLIWKGREKAYGKAVKSILDIVAAPTDDEAFARVREKCIAYTASAKADKFLFAQGLTPLSLLSAWNKLHGARAKSPTVSASEIPDHTKMTADGIRTAFERWPERWSVLDMKERLPKPLIKKFIEEHGGYAPALIDLLVSDMEAASGKR